MPLNLIYYDLAYLTGVVPDRTLIELTNDAGGTTLGEEVLNAASARAAAAIDAFFSEDYQVPFVPVPNVIADIAARLTLVLLWERRDAANVPEPIRELKSDIEREMNRLRESGIPGTTLKDGGTAFEALSNKSKNDRVFSQAFLNHYRTL